MKQVTADIAVRCLRRWDGILGMKAGTDSGGAKAGIWRQEYDGVRCAVLVLAMRKKNDDMLASVDSPPGESETGMTVENEFWGINLGGSKILSFAMSWCSISTMLELSTDRTVCAKSKVVIHHLLTGWLVSKRTGC